MVLRNFSHKLRFLSAIQQADDKSERLCYDKECFAWYEGFVKYRSEYYHFSKRGEVLPIVTRQRFWGFRFDICVVWWLRLNMCLFTSVCWQVLEQFFEKFQSLKRLETYLKQVNDLFDFRRETFNCVISRTRIHLHNALLKQSNSRSR